MGQEGIRHLHTGDVVRAKPGIFQNLPPEQRYRLGVRHEGTRIFDIYLADEDDGTKRGTAEENLIFIESANENKES